MKHISLSRHSIVLLTAALLFAAVIPFGCSSGDDVVEGPTDGDVTPTDGDEDNDPVDIDTMDVEDQQPDGDKDDDIDDAEPIEVDTDGPFIHCPTTLSMGYVTIGEPVGRTLSCQNLGTDTLTIYEITMVQGAREEFELIDPPPPVRNVPVQGSFSQDITYDPVDPGKDCATVTVVSNAVNDPTFTIEVCSEYKGDPEIDVSPTSHDFGEVVPNSTPLVRTITIENPQVDPQANAVLVIDQISNESGSTADFEPVVADTFPIYLSPNSPYTFEIQFHPSRVTPEPLTDKIIISHNADEPPVEIVVSGRAAVPIIECSPVDEQNNINWGQIKAGTSVEKILSCENIGGSTLHIREVKLSDSTDAEFSEHDTIGPAGAFLARGAPIDIYLTYSPVNLGVNQGQVIIESNDETTPQLRISLLGAAIDSRLTAIPASVNYGEVVVGESEAQSFTLRNDGQAPVKILDLSFGENEQEFTVPVNVMQTVINTTLGHLEAIDVEVVYSPIDAGVDSRALQVISDDSHNPTLDVTLNGIGLAAKIGITCPEHPLFDTEGIDFDEVALGQSVNTDCYITNLGTTDMNITVDITGQTPQDEFWVVQEAFLPTPPGESKILTLRYTPLLVEGEDLGVVTVFANDPQMPRWDIDLRGMAVNPDIMVVPITSDTQAYDFGPHLVGSQTTMPFYISNTGSMGDLVIYSVEFTETSDDAFRYELTEQLPISIGPGGSRSLGVFFRPLAESSFAAQLQITSNDLDEQVSTIYLTGTGESCPDGWWDIDGNPTNGPLGDGCEYRCDLSDPPYELCDNIDNDCDGVTDPPNAIDNCPPRNHSSVMCDAGTCEYTCDSDFHQCGDECVYDGNSQNCGSSCTPCDVPEFAIPSCTLGGGGDYQCGFDCIAGYREHEGICKRENSPECCGPDCIECLNPPQGGYLACEQGICTPKCESGDHLCGAQCVDNYSVDHCGSSCLPCADPENGQATCNGLECGVVCNAFFHPQGDECILNNTTDCCGFECTSCPPNTATKISVCDNYYCDFQCVPGSHRCSNECLYDDDPDNCGTNCWPCFEPPHSESQCSRPSTSDPWACSFDCDQGFHAEGDYCFANDSDPAHCGLNDRDCGSCCTPQHAIPLCIEGECDFACEIGYHRCDDQCYDDYDSAHCMVGEACQACPTVPHALSTCSPQLWQDPCGYTCYQGYLDLNGDPADGCEYTCEPSGDTDLPDDLFTDTNCDGIDGTVDQAVFVSHTGNDINPGTRDRPKRSIQAAINTTYSTPSRKYVLVSEGIYEESITLKGGVSVFGGYSQAANWTRSTAYKAIIQGIDPIAVEARGISVPTEIAWMEIRGKNFSSDGISSYAVYAIDSSSNLRFNNCTITGGEGGNGENGIDGAEAGVSGNRGGNGEAGSEDACNTGDGGTGGGYSPCGTGRSGGGGGCGSGDGASGSSVYGCTGGPGGHGVGNCWEQAGNGTAGGDGNDGDDGNAGSNGNTTGNVSYSFWVGHDGGAGQDGDSGTAGCGGGGGGGGDGWILCSNDSGGGGGQGGGAGCGGDAGLGGHPGGGSFAIFLVNAHVTIESCTIGTEGGGDGGDGGLGQAGGNGGSGGSGGDGFDSSGDGGAGGRGGNGGHGGRGGGGGGGISVGIYKTGSSNPVIDPLTMQYNIGPGGDAGNNGDQALSEEIYP